MKSIVYTTIINSFELELKEVEWEEIVELIEGI